MSQLPSDTVEFAHRMFEAARTGDSILLLSAVDSGLPANLTNDKGFHPSPMFTNKSLIYLFIRQYTFDARCIRWSYGTC